MTDEPAGHPVYVRYQDFLDADPRRTHNALELGSDWRDGDARYRVCWYEQTHELTAERLTTTHQLAVEDFHHGISGARPRPHPHHPRRALRRPWRVAQHRTQPARTLAWLKHQLANNPRGPRRTAKANPSSRTAR